MIEYSIKDIGNNYISREEFCSFNLNDGIIDKNGNLYVFKRVKDNNKELTHNILSQYLYLKAYLRIAYFLKYNDGIVCPEYYGEYIDSFVLNENMSIALYNIINNKIDNNCTTFEEKLAKYVTDFGYHSVKYNTIPQIYNYELFNKNIKVLSYTLDKKFDRKFFIDILNK